MAGGHGPAFAEEASPKIEFDVTEQDMGTMAEGDKVKFEFIIKNTGDADLEISRLRSLCDCTVVSVDDTLIPPGGNTILRGVFDSAGRWGDQNKMILVYSNASNASQAPVRVKVVIKSGIRVEPASFSFGELKRKGTASQTIKISARLDERLKITKFTIKGTTAVQAKAGKRQISEARLPDGRDGYLTEYEVELTAKNTGAGDFSGELEMETDYSKKPRLQVLFSGETTGDLEAKPMLLRFPKAAAGQSVESTVTITSLVKKDFTVTGIEADDLPFRIHTAETKAQREQEVVVQFSAPENPKRFYRGYIYLLTDHPSQKRIKVGVNAVTQQ
jgi:hypothetical protein